MVKISQHTSPEYTPRTYFNVSNSDVTIALAIDHTTAGEILTHNACVRLKKPILRLSLYDGNCQNIDAVVKFLTKFRPKVVNIAGNGIYTFKVAAGSDQLTVNSEIYKVLARATDFYSIDKIISGGQTGVDWAAGVAANMLGIDCHMTLPLGYKQRDEFGKDFTQTNVQLRHKLVLQTKQLKKHLNN